jgi:hypothetical protein
MAETEEKLDMFTFPPQLWFGLLCEGVMADPLGRLSFQAVFNQVAFFDPPGNTGMPPNAFLNGVLAVGFTDALGHFEVEIELRDIDSHTLWQRPAGRWAFDMGPGQQNAAVLVEQVRYWFTQPGRYHFWLRVEPNAGEHSIPFEVGRQIGPASLVQGGQPPVQP